MMTTAKGLTSGYVPMGALFVAPRVAEPFFNPSAGVWWRHGYTYGGHAAAAAAAMATWTSSSGRTCSRRRPGWRRPCTTESGRTGDHPAVAEVRSGTGAVAAVQLVDPGPRSAWRSPADAGRGDQSGRRRRHPDLAGVRDHRRAGRRDRRRGSGAALG